MAIIPKGSMFDGMRGRLGDLVFRVQGDQTIVSHRPKRPKTPPEKMSEARRNNQIRFQQAVEFARDARRSSAFRSLSRLLRSHSPYHIALQDYLSKPEIEAVETTGGEQPVLTIHVSERVAVRSVRIRRVERAGKKASPSAPAETSLGSTSLSASSASSASPSISPTPSAHSLPAAEPKPEAPRLPPAATFFKKIPPPATPSAITGDIARPAMAMPSKSNPDDAKAQRVIHAVRVSEQKGPRDFKHDSPNIEIWQARIPWDGEIEIVAADYAGNRAIQLMQISDDYAN